MSKVKIKDCDRNFIKDQVNLVAEKCLLVIDRHLIDVFDQEDEDTLKAQWLVKARVVQYIFQQYFGMTLNISEKTLREFEDKNADKFRKNPKNPNNNNLN